MNVPILMLTYNRLSYTKLALAALTKCRGADIYIIDDHSTDGTAEWLFEQYKSGKLNINRVLLNSINIGIAGSMNRFLDLTKQYKIVSKVDCDTIVQPDFIEKMLPHMQKADIVQARHHILKATHPGGFDEWVKTMKGEGALKFHHFVGGTAILMNRQLITRIPETTWKLGGFREFQRQNPNIIKAFATDVTVQLLDTDQDGANYLPEYESYYQTTKRL